jgi:hypothetical protein
VRLSKRRWMLVLPVKPQPVGRADLGDLPSSTASK